MRRVRRQGVGLLVLAALLPALVLSLSACSVSRPVGVARASADTTTSPRPAGGKGVKTIYVAGGCFWGVQKYMSLVHGVVASEVGYANGTSPSATYDDGSGYAETVRVDYDPSVAPLPFVLDLFYRVIDPTSLNRQGNDVGTEYRTGVYYTDPADREIIEASLARLQKSYTSPVVVEVAPLKNYAPAEKYHQDYLDKNPGGYCHIRLDLFKEAASARPDPSQFPKQ